MQDALLALDPVAADAVVIADGDIEVLDLGPGLIGDLFEHIDPGHGLDIGVGDHAEHGLSTLVVLAEPAETLGVTFDQLAELLRPRVEEHFTIRPERNVEIDQRCSAEATGLKHVDVIVAVYLDEPERIPG